MCISIRSKIFSVWEQIPSTYHLLGNTSRVFPCSVSKLAPQAELLMQIPTLDPEIVSFIHLYQHY